MRCDIIVVENLRFLPSIRKRKAEVFKSLHSGDRFKKLLFWCPKTPFTWKRRAKTEKKNPYQFRNTTGSRVTIVVA